MVGAIHDGVFSTSNSMLTSHDVNVQAPPGGHLKTSSFGGGPGTPRSSPFRRPDPPSSPSTLRQTTPSASPLRTAQPNNNSRFVAGGSPSTPTGTAESLTPKARLTPQPGDDMFGSPRQRAPPVSTASTAPITGSHGNALSQLQPAQVRTLREGFQILDRDSDGVVNREDVTDMLNQLGMAISPHHAAIGRILTGCFRNRPAIHRDRRLPLLPRLCSRKYHLPRELPQQYRHRPCRPLPERRAPLSAFRFRRRRQRSDRFGGAARCAAAYRTRAGGEGTDSRGD